ncbi:MAG: glyoxalase [Acidobacteria bacterium]|jgi:catechol 2,3-dioxygenase-like lactoylglutathione lyase family enzyme|nr:MAG: glyoxalase [Acidobacteriota bacterium]
MKINGVVETAIHVDDVERSAAFYQRLFELERLAGDDRFCALAVPGHAVFLLFKKGGTLEPVHTPYGIIPPHGGAGRLHFAFKISADSLADCERTLAQEGIAIESKVHWPLGGISIYFRDPDQHCVELITPGCWAVY